MPPLNSIFVVGSGLMGHGIAQSAAMAGCAVTLYDIEEGRLQSGLNRIGESLSKLRGKNLLGEKTVEEVISRIRLSTTLDDAKESHLVLEAVPEIEETKRQVFSALDKICAEETVFCTNTSAFPISRLAAATQRADRFCGMHFFSPVVLMSLVEVIKGERTTELTFQTALAFVRRLGKEPVEVHKDSAGFIVSRILNVAALEAMRLVESGVAGAADIDKALRLGCGHKMGLLETADMSGLDVVLSVAETLRDHSAGNRFEIPPILQQLVDEGKLGRKTGQGFFNYNH